MSIEIPTTHRPQYLGSAGEQRRSKRAIRTDRATRAWEQPELLL